MELLVVVALVLVVWLVVGVGVALVIGRVVRRGDEHAQVMGSWRASVADPAPARRDAADAAGNADSQP
ncbi:hypothetical protein ACIGCK_13640 [Microbacterium sp. NPDC078428]|uniref:hypothetical protein n=1 Tax=Microbacterium sp. NPDC078428 TaxID=3364190 RepID=UPI0037C85CB4